MIRKLIIFNTLFIMAQSDSSYNNQNLSSNHQALEISKRIRSNCQSLSLCHLIKGFNVNPVYNPHFITSISPLYPRQVPKTTAIQSRSYYNYGGNALPAYYPTFDPISLLASLAFLAFLLQSFVSLFDRSRSIIPAIVSSRDSPSHEIPDITKLIMHAIDEYDIFNQSFTIPEEKELKKLS